MPDGTMFGRPGKELWPGNSIVPPDMGANEDAEINSEQDEGLRIKTRNPTNNPIDKVD